MRRSQQDRPHGGRPCAALPASDERLAALRNYLWEKSVGLRAAFDLGQAAGPAPA